MSEIRIKVVPTLAGTAWEKEKAYRLLDYVVVDGATVYMSRKVDSQSGVNKGHELTDSEWWDKGVDVAALAATAKRVAAECAAQTDKAGAATKEARAQAQAAQDAASTATAAAENAATQATAAQTATAGAKAATAAAEKVNATLESDDEKTLLTVTDSKGTSKAVELTTQAQATQTRADVEVLKTDVAALRRDVDMGRPLFAGFTRVNGSADPKADETYGTKEALREIGRHMRMAVVKGGKVVRWLAPGRITADVNGGDVAIDGSMGDVLCVTDAPLHLLHATETVDGVERNMMGVGLGTCSWYGHEAKRIPKFGMTPGYTVNAKIDGDAREQAHSIYNTAVSGTYGSPTKLFNEVYRKNGGKGLFSHSVSGVKNLQMAQAKNDDPLTARPYMGLHPDMYGLWLAMMYTECGTLNTCQSSLLGSGITSSSIASDMQWDDTEMSAVSGIRVLTADGAVMHMPVNVKIRTVDGAEDHMTVALFGVTLYACTEMLEAQRVMDGVTKHGWTDKVGDNDAFFYWGDDGELAVTTRQDGLDPRTGVGMEAARTYYQVRGCAGCEGLADGVMTGVVNAYVRMTFADGVGVMYNGAYVDVTGGQAIVKLSRSVYRGMSIPLDGCFKHISYLYNEVYGGGTENTAQRQYCTRNIEDVEALTTFGQYDNEGDVAADMPILRGLTCVRVCKEQTRYYYAREGRYNLSLLSTDVRGGSLNTYECAYIYDFLAYGLHKDNGLNGIAYDGRKAVCALAVGCSALYGTASARTLVGNFAVGYGNDSFAGAFAVLLGQ